MKTSICDLGYKCCKERKICASLQRIDKGKSRRSLVIGRLQCNAWVTRPARVISQSGLSQNKNPAQVILNDLARVLLGVTRADRYRSEDLLDKANVPTLNQIVVRQAAVSAWRTANGGVLEETLLTFDSRTRGANSNLRRPVSQRCTATKNMTICWNSSKALRSATTLQEARTVAKSMAKEVRHF